MQCFVIHSNLIQMVEVTIIIVNILPKVTLAFDVFYIPTSNKQY